MTGERTSAPLVAILATCNTKQAEADFLASALIDCGLRPVIVDISISKADQKNQLKQKIDLMQASAESAYKKLIELMDKGLAGAIGIGGGTGTWVCIQAMDKLVFGWPKVIVSTLAYDVRASIASNDIILMPSVADIQGLNPTLRKVLENAAAVMFGFTNCTPPRKHPKKPVIGITSLGVTNDAVTGISDRLIDAGFEVTTFHATGMGGHAYERWVSMGKLDGVIDLTTQELHGLSYGAPIVCDQNRLLSAAAAGVPQVIIPGGMDFIAHGHIDTLTKHELTRPRFCHSPEYTHIRATDEQITTTAKIMAERLNGATGPLAVVVPLGGFSVEGSRSDGAMWDPDLCKLFTAVLQQHLNSSIPVTTSPKAITSPGFHDLVLRVFFKTFNQSKSNRS